MGRIIRSRGEKSKSVWNYSRLKKIREVVRIWLRNKTVGAVFEMVVVLITRFWMIFFH